MSSGPVPIADLLIHAEFVRGLARDLVRDPHAGDDLAQDVWLQALRRPPHHGASLRGWLAALVASLSANHVRGERRRAAREAAVPPPREVDGAADIVAKEQVRQRLLAAVLRLDEPFRTAVLLRYHEERSPAEIASQLGVPAATVRTRIARGLDKLRCALDREHGGERAAWAVPLAALPAPRTTTPTLPLTVLVMNKLPLVAAAVLVAAVSFVLVWLTWLAPPPAALPTVPVPQGAPALASGAARPAAESDAAADGDGARTAATGGGVVRAPSDDVEPTGELLVTVTWHDETPAAGVRVNVASAWPGVMPRALVVADADGRARTAVPPGKVLVRTDRDAKDHEVDVVAGRQATVTVKLGQGVDVSGVVRGADGEPVVGATVWLTSFQQPWAAMAPVATSDAHGAFALRAVPRDQSLGATANGCVPSPLVCLDTVDHEQAPLRVELVIGAAGGVLTGRVVDEQGGGVAGARVAVGQGKRLVDHAADGRMVWKWAPAQATTDDTGAYRFDSLAPGLHPVEVWSRAHPFWHGEVIVTAADAARLDVTLLRGVTVHGVVSGEDGAPLARAVVRAFPKPIDETFLMTGQFDYDSTFGYPFAIADDAGRYRLHRAASGELQLYASAERPRRQRSQQTSPWAHHVVAAAPGAEVEWSPQVEPGPTIRGVARYRDGAPMRHLFVTVTEPGQKRGKSIVTDDQGRFRFVRLQPKAYDVSLQVWDPPKGAPPVEARDVWPDRGELELTAAFDAPRPEVPGKVRGTIVDAAGRAASAAELRVVLVNDGRSWHTHGALAEGRFEFSDVEPGPKRLVVTANEAPVLVGPEFVLQAAEDKDVGVLTTEPGGKLVVEIVRGPGAEAAEPELYLVPTGSNQARKVALGLATSVTVDNLCLGEHSVSLWHERLARIRTSCRVAAGEPARLHLTLRAAVQRELVVEYAADQRLTRIRVADDRDTEVYEFSPDRVVDRPFRRSISFPLGTFKARVETAGGGVAEVPFEMTTLEPGQAPVVVRAR